MYMRHHGVVQCGRVNSEGPVDSHLGNEPTYSTYLWGIGESIRYTVSTKQDGSLWLNITLMVANSVISHKQR